LLPHFLTLLALAIPQDEGSVPGILEHLTDLTNGYSAFRVTYEVTVEKEGEDTKTSRLELGYEAPDAGQVRMSVDDSAQFVMAIRGEDMFLWNPDEEEWHRGRMPAPQEALDELESSFPSNAPLEPGAYFQLRPGPEGKGLTLNAGMTILPRKHLLSWLGVMAAREDEVELAGEDLRWRSGEFEMLVSAEHGFPLEIHASGESETTFKLLDCALDEACDREAVEIPREALSAAEDGEMTAYFERQLWNQTRDTCFQRVQHLLDEDEISWGGLTETRFTTVLELLHRPRILSISEERVRAMTPGFERAAASLREHLEREGTDEARERARQEARKGRAQIEAGMDELRANLLDGRPAPQNVDDLRPELIELEDEVLGELVDELVKAAVLAAFDEALAEFLED
jgi:hypothetical protein